MTCELQQVGELDKCRTFVCVRSSTEDCLVLICCGLYDLLRGILLLLPDLMLEEVMDKLIQPEALIVLVNHSSPLIQQGVMKVGPGLVQVVVVE